MSGLVADPAPPLLVSFTSTVGVLQLSVAVASLALAAGTSERHWKLKFAGAVIAGGTVSIIVIVTVAVSVPPLPSLTV